MNIRELYAALQPFTDTAAGTLTVPAGSVTSWTAVHDLLDAALANQTLAVTGIASFPSEPTGNSIAYQGQAALFPWSGAGTQTGLSVTATFSVDQAGTPQLLVRAVVPGTAGWTLANSLSGLAGTDLAGVVFDGGVFALTSQAVAVADFPGPVDPFVAFTGSVDPTGPYGIGQALLPTPASRIVSGPVDLTAGVMPAITLSPVGGAPVTIAGIDFEFGAAMSSYYRELPYYDADHPDQTTVERPFSNAGLVATVAFGAGPALGLTMPVLPASDHQTLTVVQTDKPLSSWADLDPLTGGINLGTLIPPEVPAAQSLVLRKLALSLYFPDDTILPIVTAMELDVLMDLGEWPLLPNGILTVQRVGAAMTILFGTDGSTTVAGSLYTDFAIVEEVQMTATLNLPQLSLTASLQPGITVAVESLMASVLEKLTGHIYVPPIEMDISRLDMAVDVPNRTFGFGTDILTDWSIAFGEANGGALITLSFQGISFDINYDGQLLQATFVAYAGINEGRFYFGARSPGDGVGWAFAGGLMTGSTLSVTNLLLNFMFPTGTIPGRSYGIPDLVIDTLSATLATDATNTPSAYTFEGGLSTSWTFSVFPGGLTLQLRADVALRGTRATESPPELPRLARPGRGGLVPVATAPTWPVADDAPWQIAGSVLGLVNLFNLEISAGYQFAPDNSSLSFGIWYKGRGLQATLTQEPDPKTRVAQTILTIRLGDLSFGEILEYLINLALPGETRRLPSPWDVLYQVNFKNLSLVANLTTSEVLISYHVGLDLGFAQFTSIGLRYRSVNGEGRVYVELVGEFLGQSFGGADGEPLTWDAINDPAPEVPGKGGSFLDLRYVGFGQHVALSVPISELDTVEKVVTALRASMRPVTGTGNPLSDPAAASLRYDGNSNWLFGLDATILDTVSLSMAFLDPNLYGGVIALAGERAGGLSGLRFELLYRKVTEDIGELSADFRVPDAFRHLEFGAVSVTLGLVHVDIYTNGNFKIDLGFPHNQDFSQSFAVEVFPFVGEGGFYFGYLTGATSKRVPQITNGTFSPVIEAGLGLSVGLGKDFQAGPLKAGLKVEVYGIFEGVFAPFSPYDRAVGTAEYYWIQGTAGVVGTLYGSVDFVVIKAEVSIVARASVTFVLEAYRPSLVELSLSVTAKAKIKILFITIHFSFEFALDESFVIGSASATPWTVGGSSERQLARSSVAAMLGQDRPELAGFAGSGDPSRLTGLWGHPRLRQQRNQAPVRALSRIRYARWELPSLLAEPSYRSRHQARLLAGRGEEPRLAAGLADPAPDPWSPLPVFGTGNAKTARLQFVPMFTVADPTSLYDRTPQQLAADGTNQVEIALGFVAENATDPGAHGAAQLRRFTDDHVHHLSTDGTTPVADMVEAFFRWAAQAGAGKAGDDDISLLALQDLLTEVGDPAFQAATFEYGNLTGFLVDSLHLEIAGYPTGGGSDTSGTMVALPPEITATLVTGSSSTERDYRTYQPVSTAYATNLTTYFRQLLTDATSEQASEPRAAGRPLAETAEPARPPGDPQANSLAELIFGEYFALLTQASLQAAVALLQNYPVAYPASGGPSLSELARSFSGLSARVRLGRGQRLADMAAYTGHHPARLAAANPGLGGDDSRDDSRDGGLIEVPVEVTPLSIAEDNRTATLATGLVLQMPSLPYQVRSGQTLDDVAASIPYVATTSPISGAAVGTASQDLVGLLRTGEGVPIPAFTYQAVSGDTQNFLTAFMTVRNLGPVGVANLDWYEQAIATLNPTVLDWTAPAGTIQVPYAYLDSTADNAVDYTVHPGDTLARIAGAFSLFQAMDNTTNPVVTDPVTIPAMTHPVAPLDTFASLVQDFPGLTLVALVGANTGAAVLTPLAVLRLPAFTAVLPAAQSLAGVAAAYDLSLADLVDIVETVPALFAGGDLTVRDVPARSVNDLVTDLTTTGQLNTIATQVSNFLAHGLRAPAPDDTTFTDLTPQQVADGDFTGHLYGISDLIGQQFSWPDTSVSAQLTLTLPDTANGWLSLVDTTTTTGDGPVVSAELGALNPRLAAGQVPRDGLIVATGTTNQLDLAIDQASFGGDLPSTTVTLNASAPAALVNFEETPVHYNFQATQHWQAAVRPALPSAPAPGQPGEPSLWPLPGNLQLLADSGSPGTYGLRVVPLGAVPGTPGLPLASYCWAVQIPISINRVANPNDPASTGSATSELGSPWLDGLYLVNGASAGDSDRLYQLWTYLAGGSDSATISLLYPPNATSTTPMGYASDAVDPAETVLLKTNLSTVTRDPGLRQDGLAVPGADTYSAPIGTATDFLCLLWQASVVVPGGFYLRYDADGAALPDAMFDDAGRGSLQVLCLLASQSGATEPGGAFLAVNNVALVADNVDASAVQLYAVRTDGDGPTTRVATMPPGSVGYSIDRTDPAPPEGSTPTPTQLSGMLYSLFGYQLQAGTGFTASNEAVPQNADEGAAAGTLNYRQVLSVYRRATADGLVAQANPWLPAADEDPYAGISATSQAAVSFAAHDVFGNRAIVTDPIAGVALPDRYTDRLYGLGDWPGTTWSYSIAGTTPDARLLVDGGLQAANYLPAPDLSAEKALRSASSHAVKLAAAYYQVRRPNLELTIDGALAGGPQSLSLAPLIGYLSGAYTFTSQLAGLAIGTCQVTEGQTLAAVAAANAVSAEDLLADNADRAVSALFATTVVVPQFGQMKHGEAIDAFAERHGTTAVSLLGQWGNGDAPVPGGTDLVISPTTGAIVAGWTLAQYAAQSQCTVGDLATANATAPGLIADGVSLAVGAVRLQTAGSTFSSLVAAFAAQGVTTTAAEIAVANQGVSGIFAVGGQVTTYAVDRRLLATASTVDGLVDQLYGGDLATFCSLNGALAGLLPQDLRLQVGQSTVAAPPDPLGYFVDQSGGFSLADFATANGPTILATGVVLLLPAQLQPATLAAVPYAIQPGLTLHQIATRFGVSPDQLGTQNQDQPAVLVPDQPVTVPGFGTQPTAAGDSLASLQARWPAGGQPTMTALIAAVADQTGLMLPDGVLVCPVPTASAAGSADPLTIDQLAGTFLTADAASTLAQCNAALAGFLKVGAQFALDGETFTVTAGQTLANTLGLVNGQLDSPMTYDAFLAAMLDQPVVDPASKVLLPPPPVEVAAALPATVPVTGVFTELSCSVTLRRPADEVDTNFTGVANVSEVTTPLTPTLSGEPATLAAFASALATAYGGQLWLATASAREQGQQRQYLIRFEAPGGLAGNAIRSVALGGQASFLGLPPLANSLISRTADVRAYRSGGDPPFTAESQTLMFQAVDVTDWARDFLATLDLALSPSYASAGYLATAGPSGSDDFNALVAAKSVLAAAIAGQLTPVEVGDTPLDLTSAQQSLEQLLRVNLSAGYNTDAVVQVATTVDASFAGTGSDAGGHRLTGKVSANTQDLSTTSTLQELATRYTVSVEAVVEVLAATTNILQTDAVLELDDVRWTIAEHDSLSVGIQTLGTTPVIFASTFATTAPLFRDGVALTVDGFGAQVGLGDTLGTMADALDVDLGLVALANEDQSGLLTGTVYLNGVAVPITDQISSLSALAAAQHLTVPVLAGLIASQAVLTVGATLHVLRWVPEYSLTMGKIDLDTADGALTLLLSLKNRAQYRRLFLNLGFGITALEYRIEPAAYVEGYQTSQWMHPVNPLPSDPTAIGGAVIDPAIGQLDIPIALRAYPATPRLVNQSALATFSAKEIATTDPIADRLDKIESWTYLAGFELQLAAQDAAVVTVGLNFSPPPDGRGSGDEPDPFPALAEYASNASAIKGDLATLVQVPGSTPPTGVSPGQSAMAALADLATKVSDSWGFVPPTPTGADAPVDDLVPAESYSFALQTRTRSADHGEQVLSALVLVREPGTDRWGPAGKIPDLAYVDADGLRHSLVPPDVPVGEPPQSLTYTFAEPVPAGGRLVYLAGYAELNVVAYQNARASLSVLRNQNLAPGSQTTEQFVYRTPPLTFTNLAVPSLLWAESLLFGTGSEAALPAALTTLFTDVLGSPPTAATVQQKLSGSYGYRLAAAGGGQSPLSPDDLVSLTPMFYRPRFSYRDTVPAETGAAVTDWSTGHVPEPDNVAFLSLALQLFSTMMPGRTQPLLALGRLDYQLTDG